jgi:hypothetical protein
MTKYNPARLLALGLLACETLFTAGMSLILALALALDYADGLHVDVEGRPIATGYSEDIAVVVGIGLLSFCCAVLLTTLANTRPLQLKPAHAMAAIAIILAHVWLMYDLVSGISGPPINAVGDLIWVSMVGYLAVVAGSVGLLRRSWP